MNILLRGYQGPLAQDFTKKHQSDCLVLNYYNFVRTK